MGRRMWYSTYLFTPTWLNSVVILFLVIATAFMGYFFPRG